MHSHIISLTTLIFSYTPSITLLIHYIMNMSSINLTTTLHMIIYCCSYSSQILQISTSNPMPIISCDLYSLPVTFLSLHLLKITYRYLPTFESLINLSFNHKYFSSTQSTSLLPQKALQIVDDIELFMGLM